MIERLFYSNVQYQPITVQFPGNQETNSSVATLQKKDKAIDTSKASAIASSEPRVIEEDQVAQKKEVLVPTYLESKAITASDSGVTVPSLESALADDRLIAKETKINTEVDSWQQNTMKN